MNRDPEKMPLDKEEQWYEDHADEFVPASEELRRKLIRAAKRGWRKKLFIPAASPREGPEGHRRWSGGFAAGRDPRQGPTRRPRSG